MVLLDVSNNAHQDRGLIVSNKTQVSINESLDDNDRKQAISNNTNFNHFSFHFFAFLANLCKGCFGNPCENNAVCVEVSKEPTRDEKFYCNCPVPFFGRKCEKWGKIIISV